MTTAQFIYQTYNTIGTKERRCSSVFTDMQGVVYSYGYHYPLAFAIGGLNFINVAGYSSSTAKHIAWAKNAIGYDNYIGVKLSQRATSFLRDNSQMDSNKLLTLLSLLEVERDEIELQMASKNRKDTSVFAWLEHQFDELSINIKLVKQAI